jgi:hypothetical protein
MLRVERALQLEDEFRISRNYDHGILGDFADTWFAG